MTDLGMGKHMVTIFLMNSIKIIGFWFLDLQIEDIKIYDLSLLFHFNYPLFYDESCKRKEIIRCNLHTPKRKHIWKIKITP